MLRQVDVGLRAVGARAVLLKGMALRLRARERGIAVPPRATGDLDVYVGAALGPALRRHLIQRGFRGDSRRAADVAAPPGADRAGEGILVEIHTRIAAPFWGLPEADMLARTEPLGPLERFEALGAPKASSSTRWSTARRTSSRMAFAPHGTSLPSYESRPDLDWDRLARWVAASRVPRGFWVPTAALSRELGLPVPPDFLRGAPRDALQRDLEAIARRRLFRVASGSASWTRSAGTRSCSAALLLPGAGVLSRHAVPLGRRASPWPETVPAPSSPGRAGLRQAWRHFHQYRRALARADTDED